MAQAVHHNVVVHEYTILVRTENGVTGTQFTGRPSERVDEMGTTIITGRWAAGYKEPGSPPDVVGNDDGLKTRLRAILSSQR